MDTMDRFLDLARDAGIDVDLLMDLQAARSFPSEEILCLMNYGILVAEKCMDIVDESEKQKISNHFRI